MSEHEFDLAIIGGGCIGMSILRELVGLGFRDMVLLDNGRKTNSATANSGGMLRVFHENIDHIDLALGNFRRLEQLEKASSFADEAKANGSLYFFHRDRLPLFADGLKKMKAANYPFEVLCPREGSEKFPEFRWSTEDMAIYEPLGRQINPNVFVDKLLEMSVCPGVKVLESFDVKRICPYLNRYIISGNDRTLIAKALILAGGASLMPRFKDLGLTLALEARKLATFTAERTESAFVKSCTPNYFDRETLSFAGFGQKGSVILSHPKQNRIVEDLWKPDFQEKVAEDCYAPGRLGILGQLPGHPQLFLATGWGGTAFKFALEVGHRMGRILESTLVNKRELYA